tara:strand:+ start:23 stop:709 length:687 start_codon:yes stop_codon:yes gene_type:complete
MKFNQNKKTSQGDKKMKAVKLNPSNKYAKLDIEFKNFSICANDLIQDSKILNHAMDILGVTKAEFLSVVTNLHNKLEDAQYSVNRALDQVEDAKCNVDDIESYCYDARSSLDSTESDLEDAKMNLRDVMEDVDHAETATPDEVVEGYLKTIGFEETKKETEDLKVGDAGEFGVVSSVEVKEDKETINPFPKESPAHDSFNNSVCHDSMKKPPAKKSAKRLDELEGGSN